MAEKVVSKSSLGFLTRKIGPVPIWLIALAIVAVAYWYEHYGPGASSSSAAAAAAAGTDPNTGELYSSELAAAEQQIQDLQSQPQPTTTTGTTPPPVSVPPTTPTPPPTPAPAPTGTVTVPKVVGERANTAIGTLESSGLKWSSTTGDRNPKDEYTVTAQSPAAGTKAAKGSTVALTWKVTAAPKTAKAVNATAAAVAPQGLTRWRNAA